MNVVLSSIPHTGTWFTVRLFTERGFNEKGLFEKAEGDTIFLGHMMKEGQIGRAVQLSDYMPLVIPMRHPFRVEESWKRRGLDVSELVSCFQTLIERFLPLEPYILPIDSPKREEALQALSEGVGIDLKTDWEVVHGIVGTHDLDLADCEPSEAISAIVQEPFFAGLYD